LARKRQTKANAITQRKKLHLAASRSDESFADHAYKELEHLIVTAQIKPGDWVTEIALSQRLGIGRTPVREALQRLAHAHLLEIVPRRGLRITEINVRDQLMLLEFRRGVERYLSIRAAKFATGGERAQFEILARRMRDSGRSSDTAEHYRVDLDYKLLLLKVARHEYAAHAITPLWAVSRRFAWVTRFARNVKFIAELTADVIEAIANGDEERAGNSSDAFIEGLETLARSYLEAEIEGRPFHTVQKGEAPKPKRRPPPDTAGKVPPRL